MPNPPQKSTVIEKVEEKELDSTDSEYRGSFIETTRSSLGINNIEVLQEIRELRQQETQQSAEDTENTPEQRKSEISELEGKLSSIQKAYATELLNDLTKVIEEIRKKRPKSLFQHISNKVTLSEELLRLKNQIIEFNNNPDTSIDEKFRKYSEYGKEIKNLLLSHSESELHHEFQHWYRPPMDLQEKDLNFAARDIVFMYHHVLVEQGLNSSFLPPEGDNYEACTEFYKQPENWSKAAHVYKKFLDIRAEITEFPWGKWNEILEKEVGEFAANFTGFENSVGASLSRLLNSYPRIADALMPSPFIQNIKTFSNILKSPKEDLDFSEEVENNIQKTIELFITILEKSDNSFKKLILILLQNNPEWKNKNSEYIKLQLISAFLQPLFNWFSEYDSFDAEQKALIAIYWKRFEKFLLNNISKPLSNFDSEMNYELKVFLQNSLSEISENSLADSEKNNLLAYADIDNIQYDTKGLPILNVPFSQERFTTFINKASQLAYIYKEIGIKSQYLPESWSSYQDCQKIYSTSEGFSQAKLLLRTLPEERKELIEDLPECYENLHKLTEMHTEDIQTINIIPGKLSDYKYAYQLQALKKELISLKILAGNKDVECNLEKLIDSVTKEIKSKRSEAQRSEKIIRLCLQAKDILRATHQNDGFDEWLAKSGISFDKIDDFVQTFCEIYPKEIPSNLQEKLELVLSFDHTIKTEEPDLAAWKEIVKNLLNDSTKINNKFADDYYLSTILIPPALYQEAESFLSRIRETKSITEASADAMAASAKIFLDSFSDIFDSLEINDEKKKKELLRTCLISFVNFIEKKDTGDEKAALQVYYKKLNKSLLDYLERSSKPLKEILEDIAEKKVYLSYYTGNDEFEQREVICGDNYTSPNFLINPDSRKGTLNLTHYKILGDNDKDIPYLKGILVKYPNLTGLNLSNNKFTPKDIDELTPALLQHENLIEVDFGSCSIKDNNRALIIGRLEKNLNRKLEILSLKKENNEISSEEEKELQLALYKRDNTKQLLELYSELNKAKSTLDKKRVKSDLHEKLNNLIKDIKEDIQNPATRFNKNHTYIRRAEILLQKDSQAQQDFNRWLKDKNTPADHIVYAAANLISIHKNYFYRHKHIEPFVSLLSNLTNLEKGAFDIDDHKAYIAFYSKPENTLAAKNLVSWAQQNSFAIRDWYQKNDRIKDYQANYTKVKESTFSEKLSETFLVYLTQGDVLDLSAQNFSDLNLEDIKAFLQERPEIKELKINKNLNNYEVEFLLSTLEGCKNLFRLDLSENTAVNKNTKRYTENLLLRNLTAEMERLSVEMKDPSNNKKQLKLELVNINNRCQLIQLKQQLEKLEAQSSGKISFSDQIKKIIQNLRSEQFNNPLLVREAARILEENNQQNLLNDLSVWYSEYKQEIEILQANDKEIIEAASAIAYIYKKDENYLNISFNSYQKAAEYYQEHLDEAKQLYRTFMNQRPKFEAFYQKKLWNPFSGSSYKTRWEDVVQIKAVEKILETSSNSAEIDISRIFNEDSLLDSVLIPFELVQLVNNSDKIAKKIGEKTGSVFLAEQSYNLKMLDYIKKQFFENPIFLDTLLKTIKESPTINNNKEKYLQLLEKSSLNLKEKSNKEFFKLKKLDLENVADKDVSSIINSLSEEIREEYLDFRIKLHEENLKIAIAAQSLLLPIGNINEFTASPSKATAAMHFIDQFSSPLGGYLKSYLLDKTVNLPSHSFLTTESERLSNTIQKKDFIDDNSEYKKIYSTANGYFPGEHSNFNLNDNNTLRSLTTMSDKIFAPQSFLFKIKDAITNFFTSISNAFTRTPQYEEVQVEENLGDIAGNNSLNTSSLEDSMVINPDDSNKSSCVGNSDTASILKKIESEQTPNTHLHSRLSCVTSPQSPNNNNEETIPTPKIHPWQQHGSQPFSNLEKNQSLASISTDDEDSYSDTLSKKMDTDDGANTTLGSILTIELGSEKSSSPGSILKPGPGYEQFHKNVPLVVGRERANSCRF